MDLLKGFLATTLTSLLVLFLLILGIIVNLNLTILNPEFIITECNNLDIYSFIIDEAKSQLPDEEPFSTLGDVLNEFKPWLEEQSRVLIRSRLSRQERQPR